MKHQLLDERVAKSCVCDGELTGIIDFTDLAKIISEQNENDLTQLVDGFASRVAEQMTSAFKERGLDIEVRWINNKNASNVFGTKGYFFGRIRLPSMEFAREWEAFTKDPIVQAARNTLINA